MYTTSLLIHKDDTKRILRFAYEVTGAFFDTMKYKCKNAKNVVRVHYTEIIPVEFPITAPNAFILTLNNSCYDELIGSFTYMPKEIVIFSYKNTENNKLYKMLFRAGINWKTFCYSAHFYRETQEIDSTLVYDNEDMLFKELRGRFSKQIKLAKDPSIGKVEPMYLPRLLDV